MKAYLDFEEELQQAVEASVDRATARILASLPSINNSPKEWLTNREAMEFLGLSKTTLQRLRANGKLPYSKVGSNIFYKYEDVAGVLEAHVVK